MLIKIRYPNHRHGSDFLCEFEKVKSEPNDANTPMSLSDAVSSRVFKYKCLQCGNLTFQQLVFISTKYGTLGKNLTNVTTVRSAFHNYISNLQKQQSKGFW